MDNFLRPGALNGIRIADFSWVWAGPYCASLLGYLGAEVIKVESRKRLDQTRYGSIFESEDFDGINGAPPFNNANLNKGSLSLDISTPEGAELARRFVATCDVVIANMRPGKMEKLGLGYEDLKKMKPDIIMMESTGFGSTGPYKGFSGFAPIFASFGGLCHLTGYEDGAPNPMSGVQDLRVGIQSAFAILAALIYRQQTGKGQYIDVSSSEVISTLVGTELMTYTMNGTIPGRTGNKDEVMAPHNVYRCAGEDHWISIAVGSDEEWKALCEVMEKPELIADERFADMFSRKKNEKEIDAILAAWTLDKDSHDIMYACQAREVAAMPSMSASEILEDPHFAARGILHTVDHPVLGKQNVLNPPWKLSETPATIRKCGPLMGESNTEILHDMLGISMEEIEELKKQLIVY